MSKERLFGLIGNPLGHSFSRQYFTEKFRREGLDDCRYELFPLPTIEALPGLLEAHPGLEGFNVTIPYKTAVLPFLTAFDPVVPEIGAVNTVLVRSSVLAGFNTDVWGFSRSLQNFLPPGFRSRALILGTGGGSKAVQYSLRKMGLDFTLVSRAPGPGRLTYGDIDRQVLNRHLLIVQATPLGMSPDEASYPLFPFHNLSRNHYLYDLIYNPTETRFLKLAGKRGCKVKNGLEMLYLQAERSWEIWNTTTQELNKHYSV